MMENATKSRDAVRFGEFELEDSGELRSGTRKVKLQEQPLQILRILLEQPGRVVPREELQKRIWPSDTFVDFDHGINNAIKRLREALGDIAETPRFIETLPRRGYRFLNAVATPLQMFQLRYCHS
jgi:DNA-binding winged-HTH domains